MMTWTTTVIPTIWMYFPWITPHGKTMIGMANRISITMSGTIPTLTTIPMTTTITGMISVWTENRGSQVTTMMVISWWMITGNRVGKEATTISSLWIGESGRIRMTTASVTTGIPMTIMTAMEISPMYSPWMSPAGRTMTVTMFPISIIRI